MERLDVGATSPYSDTELALHLARYLPVKLLARQARVLDIACGAGYAAHIMRRHWDASRVVAVDISAEAIAMAKAQYDAPDLDYISGDAVEYLQQTRERFDLVVSVETIEHVPDPEEFLRGIKRVCAPGAAVYISAPNDAGYYGPGPSLNPYHRHVFSYDEFIEMGTKVFGEPSQVMLGTMASGFATVEAPTGPPKSWSEAIQAAAGGPSQAAIVPPAGDCAVTPEGSLYFAALWGGEALPAARLSSAVACFGNERTFRMPQVGLIGADLVSGPPPAVVVLVPHDHELLSVLQHAKKVLAAKVDLRIREYTDESIREVVSDALAEQSTHLDLWGDSAVRAVFDLLPTRGTPPMVAGSAADPDAIRRPTQMAISCALLGRPADHAAISPLLAFVDDLVYLNASSDAGDVGDLQLAQTLLRHLDRAREAAGGGGTWRRAALGQSQRRIALLESQLAAIKRQLLRIAGAGGEAAE